MPTGKSSGGILTVSFSYILYGPILLFITLSEKQSTEVTQTHPRRRGRAHGGWGRGARGDGER